VNRSHYVCTPLVKVRSPERGNDIENAAGHWLTVRICPCRAFTLYSHIAKETQSCH